MIFKVLFKCLFFIGMLFCCIVVLFWIRCLIVLVINIWMILCGEVVFSWLFIDIFLYVCKELCIVFFL